MPRLVRRTWQLDGEGRSRARLALDSDRSAQRLDDLPDDPETEADAAVVAAGRGPLEAPEDPFVIVGGDAQPVIANGDDRAVVLAGDADVDRLAVAVLDRVGQEVGDDLIQPAPVPAPDDGGGRVNVQRGADARGLVGETRADLADDLGQIDDLDVQFEAPGGDAGHVEQLVDEAMQAGCLRI